MLLDAGKKQDQGDGVFAYFCPGPTRLGNMRKTYTAAITFSEVQKNYLINAVVGRGFKSEVFQRPFHILITNMPTVLDKFWKNMHRLTFNFFQPLKTASRQEICSSTV